ncbi:hypothetical protein OF83DRAFT_1180717 [Amylostereum chailletii]|nr:hypothetical protein OF83DRAFT_1180717 [Amylostereum chailletii]
MAVTTLTLPPISTPPQFVFPDSDVTSGHSNDGTRAHLLEVMENMDHNHDITWDMDINPALQTGDATPLIPAPSTTQKRPRVFDATQYAEARSRKAGLSSENQDEVLNFTKREEEEQRIDIYLATLKLSEKVDTIKVGTAAFNIHSALSTYIGYEAWTVLTSPTLSGYDEDVIDTLLDTLGQKPQYNLSTFKADHQKWTVISGKARKKVNEHRNTLKTLLWNEDGPQSDILQLCTKILGQNKSTKREPTIQDLARVAFLVRSFL